MNTGIILDTAYAVFALVMKRGLIMLETVLGIRLLLKGLQANVQTVAVAYMYRITDILIWPFKNIFPSMRWPEGWIFEIDTVVAMVGYAIAVMLVLWFVRAFRRY